MISPQVAHETALQAREKNIAEQLEAIEADIKKAAERGATSLKFRNIFDRNIETLRTAGYKVRRASTLLLFLTQDIDFETDVISW